MAERTSSDEPRVNVSAGHLSVHVEGAHPPEVHFSFENQAQRLPAAFLAALCLQAALLGVFIVLGRSAFGLPSTPPALPEETTTQLVWLSEPGPGGGGGGGGNRMQEPPRQAELPGKDKLTVPVQRPPKINPQPQPKPEEPKPQQMENFDVPAKMLAAGTDTLPGTLDALPGPPSASQGSGSGGGAGTGTGTGIGSGTGSGLGAGIGGGTGGGVYQPGNGVTLPRILREVKPAYTSDAMRAKVQGTVLLQCVVRPDGSVSDITVLRSLDSTFGLDQEAIKAARQWRFAPGTRMGQAVPVQITIELTFTLR